MSSLIRSRFQSQAAADMAWVLGSCPLLSFNGSNRHGVSLVSEEWCTNQLAAFSDWLVGLDASPGALELKLDAASSLLGKRFEELLAFWMEFSGVTELVSRSVVFSDQGVTTGESDFLFRDHMGTLVHWEVACKYYLGTGRSREWSRWAGVNARDTLESKMQRIRVQSRIFQSSQGRDYLEMNGLEMPVSEVFLKGYLFYPFRELGSSVRPFDAASHHESGWWLHVKDLSDFRSTPGPWIILPRYRWISPWQKRDNVDVMLNGSELVEQVTEMLRTERGVMIIQADPLNGELEMSRGMVVCNDWPF